MLRNKILKLASTSVLATAISVAAFAGGPTMEPMHQSESGFTLGLNYATQLENNFVLMAGYVNDMFLADFGANYNSYARNSLNVDIWELRGDLGLRNSLTDTLFLTYGANGAYGLVSSGGTSSTRDPYAVGAFVGLDYQPMNHLLLSLKIDPYMYARYPTNTGGNFRSANEVFSDGSIGASYIFS